VLDSQRKKFCVVQCQASSFLSTTLYLFHVVTLSRIIIFLCGKILLIYEVQVRWKEESKFSWNTNSKSAGRKEFVSATTIPKPIGIRKKKIAGPTWLTWWIKSLTQQYTNVLCFDGQRGQLILDINKETVPLIMYPLLP
jgi:hypothetical protein